MTLGAYIFSLNFSELLWILFSVLRSSLTVSAMAKNDAPRACKCKADLLRISIYNSYMIFCNNFFTRFRHSMEYKVINKTLPNTSQIGLRGPSVCQLCAPGLLRIKFALEVRKGKGWAGVEQWPLDWCFYRPTADTSYFKSHLCPKWPSHLCCLDIQNTVMHFLS